VKRIGIIAILHESNTFIELPTTLEHFRNNVLVDGHDVIERFRGSQHEVGGFIDAATTQETQAVGVFAARAMPHGAIQAECWDELMGRLDLALNKYGPYDGLLVAPHGATVAENAADADGDWLQRVRNRVGSHVPIVGTLDLHANVSQKMVAATDALFGYRSNPHLDQRERGIDAAHTLVRTLRGEIAPKQALVQLPLCANIERQATAEPHGRALRAHADKLQSSVLGLIASSCLYGFPYADVVEMGASVVAVAEREAEVAMGAANDLARYWWSQRESFRGQLVGIDDSIDRALRARVAKPSLPVGLLDMGDNVGGGSPGDGTAIIHAWRARGAGPILAVLADPVAVLAAFDAGVGARLRLSVGGKVSPELQGAPIEDLFEVDSTSDGRFHELGTTHGGYVDFDMGDTAVLRGSSGVTIIATTHRVAPMSIEQVLSQGCRPGEFAAIVIKGVHAPVAAYASHCSELIRVNTQGATTADLDKIVFNNRRRPMYPWEELVQW
jgi:microcystin degradation protein MlrC